MENIIPDWTSLPMHLLADIAGSLPEVSDVSNFKGVCKAFHSSLLPLGVENRLQIPYPSIPDVNHLGHLELTESTFYSIKPLLHRNIEDDDTSTFILKLQESNTGKMIVKQPFTRMRFRNLFHLLPKSINTMDYEVKKVITANELEFVDAVTNRRHEFSIEGFSKVVVSSTCLDGARDQEFSLIGIVHSASRLCFWRRGARSWIYMERGSFGPSTAYEDVIFHNQKFYAVEMSSMTHIIDTVSLDSSIAAAPLLNTSVFGFKYLVSSLNDLFMVVKIHLEETYGYEIHQAFDSYPVRMEVYKLDIENHIWVQVNRLKDRVFLLGEDISFSLSTQEFPEFRSNCIYFNDNIFAASGHYYHPGWYPGIYDLEHNSAAPLAAFPFYSQVFWPPPRWLSQNPRATSRRPRRPRRYFSSTSQRRIR